MPRSPENSKEPKRDRFSLEYVERQVSSLSREDDHNGHHAYRHLVSSCLGIPGDAPLEFYSNPNYPLPIDDITWSARTQLLVDIITQLYGITLTDDDKKWILTTMKSPTQILAELPRRFSPTFYPALSSDFPPNR